MIMLSMLLRFRLCDPSGRCVPVADYVIDLLGSDHPRVTHLRYRDPGPGAGERALPWGEVVSADWQEERFHVASFSAARPVSRTEMPPASEDVLLHRDVLDALMLDLQNRRATRANDLALEADDNAGGVLRLVAADTSVIAMLRRITGGRLGSHVVAGKLYDWKYMEFLRGDPAAVPAGAVYHLRIARLPPGEIARLADALPYMHAAELLTLLPDKLAADTLEAMFAQRQLQVFEELPQHQQLALLGLMAPDIATDLVGRLHTELARTLLSALDPPQAARIIELLRYPEDTVGGIMTNDVLTVAGSLTILEARLALRERIAEPDFIFFIYVIDNNRSRRLRGVLPLRMLMTADDDARVEDLMNIYLVTLHALDEARAGAYRVLNSELVALPVVGREGRLLGAVTIDEAVAQVAPKAWGSQEMRIFS